MPLDTAAQKSAFTLPKAANDNEWDGRQILAWPTANRLVRSKRYEDFAMLVGYKRLLEIAYDWPANDNLHNVAPAPGEDDERSASEAIDEIDRIIIESSLKPTIAEMQGASPPWPTDDCTPTPRPTIVAVDRRTGAVRRELVGEHGGLAFVKGAELREYRTTETGKWKRPHIVLAHHRPKKKPAPSVVASSGNQWGIEDQIEARDELRLIYRAVPASTIRVLELACGNTKAQEIGEAFRKRDKTAERFGVAVIDGALNNLRNVWNPSNALCA